MIKGIRKVFIYAGLFFAFLWILQYIVDKGLRKSKMQYYAVWNDIYQSRINADIIVMGGSRAKVIISPKILDSVLHVNSYNLGINGAFFDVQNTACKVYLQHNRKPRYILQNMDYAVFSSSVHLSNSDQYIPYIDDKLIHDMASHYEEKFTIPEIYLPLFKYNNHLNLIKEGVCCYFNFGHRGNNSLYKGFGAWNIPFDDFFENRLKTESAYIRNNVDSLTESKFVAYLDYCKSNDIKLIFYYAPVLYPVNLLFLPDSSLITRKMMAYARSYNIPYLSYLEDSICYHKELFADHIHLNLNGTKVFNEHLANDLKKIINNQ
jgi:hypothetical protein